MVRQLVSELVDQHGHIWNLPLEHPSLAIIRRIHLRVTEGHIPDGFELAIAGYNLLMELFRSGPSPYATLQQIRIRHALRQLTSSSLTVKEIAAKCGCRDTANFCRKFKRRTLKTPTEARDLGRHLNLSAVYSA